MVTKALVRAFRRHRGPDGRALRIVPAVRLAWVATVVQRTVRAAQVGPVAQLAPAQPPAS